MVYTFVTSWTHGKGSGGLNQYRFNPQDGTMEFVERYFEDVAFGTVFYNKEKHIVYALDEAKDLNGGFVYSFSFDPESGRLDLLNKVYTLLPNPAYLGIDPDCRYAVVANHSFDATSVRIEKDENGRPHSVKTITDAAVVLFELNEDGSVGDPVDAAVHTGTSIAVRQNMPHPHCAVFSPDGKYCAVCDKGNDYVYMYSIDAEAGRLNLAARWKETPGFKPRYAVFHPTKPFFYHNNEGCAMVDAFSYNDNGEFTRIGEYSCLPEGSAEPNEQQGMCISPDGRTLYIAERSSAAVAVFSIDQETGALKLIQNIGQNYDWLRGICISPDGRFIAATYMNSAKVIIFRINDDGTLALTGLEYDCPNCAGIAFAEAD